MVSKGLAESKIDELWQTKPARVFAQQLLDYHAAQGSEVIIYKSGKPYLFSPARFTNDGPGNYTRIIFPSSPYGSGVLIKLEDVQKFSFNYKNELELWLW